MVIFIKEKVSLTIEKKVLKEVEGLIDGLRIRNTSQAVEYLLRKAIGEEKTAVILCGGPEKDFAIGKDYRFTVPLNSSTVIEEVIKRLKKFGFKNIFVIARENILTKMFKLIGNGDKLGIKIEYVKETLSNGTGDSLRQLRGKIKNNFLVVFGDVIFNVDLNKLWESHIKNQGTTTLLLESYPNPSEKGVVNLEGDMITNFVQKPRKLGSNIAFSSIFVTGPELLEYPGESLEENTFPKLAQEGLLFGHITSGWTDHLHKKEDIKKIEEKIKTN